MMPIFAITDVAINAIAQISLALISAVSAVLLGYIGLQGKKLKDVATTIGGTMTGQLDGLAVVAKSSHAFLNGDRGELLRKDVIKSERLAALSGLEVDEHDAQLAREAYAAHQAAQAVVDAQPGTASEKKGNPR